MDLADLKERQKIIRHLEGEGLKNVIFTNCVKDENVKQIIPMVTELIGSSYRYHRGESLEYCIMVIGVPNVGKSSLINSLRRQHLRKAPFCPAGKATRVGGEPGITRAVMSRIQVCERPLMFLLDTPGVLAPRIESVETGLKLALCGTVLDHLVGEETLADYLLYTLNRHELFGSQFASDDVFLCLSTCFNIRCHAGDEVWDLRVWRCLDLAFVLGRYLPCVYAPGLAVLVSAGSSSSAVSRLLFTLPECVSWCPLWRYVQHYGLGEACDDIVSVLKRVAVKLGKTQKVKVLTGTGDVNVIQPNYPAAARDFLRTFRSGLLGPVMLDRDTLQSHPSAGAQGHRPAETDP
ncbi:mitochondrial ribosome-associated GTPase 1 isoform X3 [Equus quagga]|nr:mitochondrial ribosome-associated GTPase 1 isoform X3 [Equus quagga]